jgi:hypothetical protein
VGDRGQPRVFLATFKACHSHAAMVNHICDSCMSRLEAVKKLSFKSTPSGGPESPRSLSRRARRGLD